MATRYPRAFITFANFDLAFNRIVRGTNRDYKQFYRHIYKAYNIGRTENIKTLIRDISLGSYKPSPPTIVFQPKKSGILRPLTLLSFRDLLTYQAIVNVIADKMKPEQDTHASTKSFGAIYAGPKSKFFFRSWKKGYKEFSTAILSSFNRGNVYVADFDLVSCYELIDHNLLFSCLAGRVKNDELLKLLRLCLATWTTNSVGRHLRHGLPQGPEASAFLAECVLFEFDKLKFRNIKYARYIDDIKLMAKDEIPLRRALLQLDLTSKELGLVPQAQKINLGKVEKAEDLTKSIPSDVVGQVEKKDKGHQKALYKLFCGSVTRTRAGHEITDVSKFKYSLLRLKPRHRVLGQIGPLLIKRPDCSHVLAAYLKKFRASKEAADILLNTLKRDPTYDAAAAHYIDAMDVCEPATQQTAYRRVIETVNRRSIEKSILLRVAILTFRARRAGPMDAARMLKAEENTIVKNIVVHRLFGQRDSNPYKLADCKDVLEEGVLSTDEDFARCCAINLHHHASNSGTIWEAPASANQSVKLLMLGLGLRKKGPKRVSVLEGFFAQIGLKFNFPWKKALGNDLADAEHRCLRIQEYRLSDPTALILTLDTFNEVILYAFSRQHPVLSIAYTKAKGAKTQPNYGSWITTLKEAKKFVVPLSSPCLQWFEDVHQTRVKGDLAHAKTSTNQSTKPIPFERAERLFVRGNAPWKELLAEWRKLLK